MAPLIRQTQKVFASNANADQLAVFGSMKTGTPIYNTALSILQSQKYTEGWNEAILNDKAPFLEEMNAVQYGFSYQIAYLLQEGIPAYDSNTEYSNTSIVKAINDNELVLYHSLSDGNIGNPLTDTTNWAKVYYAGQIGQPQFTLDFTSPLPDNCIDLNGATVSRATYAKLFAIYGTEYGAGDGSTTFNLPDFRGKVVYGDVASGYVEPELPNITGTIGASNIWSGTGSASGCVTVVNNGDHNACGDGGSRGNTYTWTIDSSRSSSIYKNGGTVKTAGIKARFYTRYQ